MLIARAPDPDKLFPAKMTANQISAIRHRLDKHAIIEELRQNQSFQKRTLRTSADRGDILKWLRNGWNTERILYAEAQLFRDNDQQFVLQWVFPQTYYAVFAVALAYFGAIGHSEKSHTSVLKRLAMMISHGDYPPIMSFRISGIDGLEQYDNVIKRGGLSSIAFNVGDPATSEHQICQFLHSTHNRRLQTAKKTSQIKNKAGKAKKAFNRSDWESVAKKIGCTTIFDLLYRKRIEANYDEVETLISEELDARSIHKNLLHIISSLNFVHEAHIWKSLGNTEYTKLIDSCGGMKAFPAVSKRHQAIISL